MYLYQLMHLLYSQITTKRLSLKTIFKEENKLKIGLSKIDTCTLQYTAKGTW